MTKVVLLNNDHEVAITDNDDDFIASISVEKITGMTNGYSTTVKFAKGCEEPEILVLIAATQRAALRANRAGGVR